jgi:hypothetical protein
VARELRGTRYLTKDNEALSEFILTELPYLDFYGTLRFYAEIEDSLDDKGKALLNANDRYYLLTVTCGRHDAWHPWLFERCREVEAKPDGHLDLWARYHYKSTICTFAGCLQEIIVDPEITIAIISGTNKVALPFLIQLQQEMERNETLKRVHPDVFWEDPRKEAPQWSREKGLVVKRKGNPKEATVEAFGLIDGMRTGKHYRLLNYDDLVDETMVNNPEIITKVTVAWELSDNLGQLSGTRKWHQGTRYSFADTYGVLLERKALKERRYPATIDGTLKGEPIMLSAERWAEIKNAQRSTVAAQMLLNPLAGNSSTFDTTRLKHYDVIPSVLNVYILVDPSKGKTRTSKGRKANSDRTAIAVIGIDVGGNKYLLDGYCHRMKLSRRWELIKQLKKKWENHPGVQMLRVGYEQYGMQVDLEVLEEKMEAEGISFKIEELNTPRQGGESKNDRIERLEPDFNKGAFYLPAVVYHPEYGGGIGNQALWDVWTAEKFKLMEDAGVTDPNKNPPVGTIVYRPMQGVTQQQRYCEATHQTYRVVTAVKRRNEDGDMYDLTRVFIEEARFHPFAPHDDLIDAVSRIYDMEPRKPMMFEAANAEMKAHPDS